MSRLNQYIVGFTSNTAVLLDLDHTTLKKAIDLCNYLNNKYRLGGFIIMQSSRRNYHAIFDKPVKWTRALSIIGMATYIFKKSKLKDWLILQTIKRCATLRISAKYWKKPPKLVYWSRTCLFQGNISDYLETYLVFNEKL